ncbi:N-acetyltransferase [Marinobacter sp. CA1]|uniref:N-acetyltransferase n=1 Tax=Marinobacter sp. CA1 TaxID=2817656 RepID=UPI001D064689|nr:N-acetyltransferase [Marinobacter sp. CA1]UDL05959.1 N-acetyltransferase [Marinobacter sp. CA1]
MIRPFREQDMMAVLDIWLAASIQAHDFIEPAFWQAQVEAMREQYLPASETWVWCHDNNVVGGFLSLNGDTLAALFVAPEAQGQGIGQSLLAMAREQRPTLELTVYSANANAVSFYRRQGFTVTGEAPDAHTGAPELTMVWHREPQVTSG